MSGPEPVTESISPPKTEAKPTPAPAPKPEMRLAPIPTPAANAAKPAAPPPQASATKPVFKPMPVEDSSEGWPEVKAETSSSGGFGVEEASASKSIPEPGESEASISQIRIKQGETTSRSEFNPDFAEQVLDFGAESSDAGKSRSDSAVTHPVAAGCVKMFGAGLIDLSLYFVIATAFGLAGLWAGAISLTEAAPSEIAGFVVPVAIAVLLVVWFYQVFFLSVLGQTPGGMIIGIEVLDKSDKRPSISRAGIRGLVYLLCLLPAGLGFIPTLLGASIPDKAADTKLVHW